MLSTNFDEFEMFENVNLHPDHDLKQSWDMYFMYAVVFFF